MISLFIKIGGVLSLLLILSPAVASTPVMPAEFVALLEENTQQRQQQRYLNTMLRRGHHDLRRSFRRLEVYRPMIERELAERGLPQFLLYLPLAESRALVRAQSSAGAAGLWQLMPATARAYGLRVSDTRDERYDPLYATRAALDMLEELYAKFKDWPLALAAYNCGPGRVSRLVRRTGQRSYAAIYRYLPSQTRHYIPRFLAYVQLGQEYSTYRLADVFRLPSTPPLDPRWESVQRIASVHWLEVHSRLSTIREQRERYRRELATSLQLERPDSLTLALTRLGGHLLHSNLSSPPRQVRTLALGFII